MSAFVVNLRNLGNGLTGVQRYTLALGERLAGQLDPIRPGFSAQGIHGHLWEQLALPLFLGTRLLWSPANTGPVLVRKQVVTIHDVSPLDHPEWFEWKFAAWYRHLLPLLVRAVRKVIVVSEFSKQRVMERCGAPAEQVEVIHNGIDSRFQPAEEGEIQQMRTKYQLLRPYVLFVGSIEPRKNLRRLIEAWQMKTPPDFDLVIAGATGHVFRDAGLDSLPPAARLLGRVSDDDLPALYSGAALFVYPSIYEGFGLPALEAMACRCPVITSHATALPEICGDAALLVDCDSTEALADAIEQGLGDAALRRRLCTAGLQRVAQFTWEKSAAKTMAVLTAAARLTAS